MTAPKLTKADRLQTQLTAARAKLEEAKMHLQPQIEVAEAEVTRLNHEYRKLEKASNRAYETLKKVRDERTSALGLNDLSALKVAMQAFIEARGLSNASVTVLANTYANRCIVADSEYLAASNAKDVIGKAKEKVYGAYNVATCPGSTLSKLQLELDRYRDVITQLEGELRSLPGRNETARQRRAEKREAELVDRDTEEARKILGEFVFSGAVQK